LILAIKILRIDVHLSSPIPTYSTNETFPKGNACYILTEQVSHIDIVYICYKWKYRHVNSCFKRLRRNQKPLSLS